MKTRILTALILLPPVIYLIGWSPWWLFLGAVMLTVVLALHEYFRICRASGFQPLPALGYAGAVGTCLAQTWGVLGAPNPTAALLGLFILLTMALALLRNADLKQYLAGVAATVLGVAYIALPLSFFLLLRYRDAEAGPRWVLLLCLVIWSGDICAYLVGRTVGRHRLFARVSPKKTYEGAVAGLGGGLLVAWAFKYWWWKTADLGTVLLLAGLVAVAGQIGDFVESAIKRGAGLKDSGSILPGHGGMLDRIDALLFGAATLWLALTVKDLGLL